MRQHCRQKVDPAHHIEAVRTPSGTGVRAKHGSLVMAKAKGGGKLHPLPFTTFGEIAALGLKATLFARQHEVEAFTESWLPLPDHRP